VSINVDESKLTDAILAAYSEEHANFMVSFLIAAELCTDLTDEELVEYMRIGAEIDADQAEQKEQQRTVIELEQFSSTADQHRARLVAITERWTERLRHRTEEFGDLIRSHFSKTSDPKIDENAINRNFNRGLFHGSSPEAQELDALLFQQLSSKIFLRR
jgi:hypothetical protein